MKQTKENGVTKIQHEISRTMSEYMKVQRQHIEMFAGAFLERVGSSAVEDYVLVERRNGVTVTWSFEPKTSHPDVLPTFAGHQRTPESYL